MRIVADAGSPILPFTGAAALPRPEFANVFREHYPYAVRLAASLTGDVELARDIAQDVFVAVFRGLPRFRGEASLRTWIYQITLRTVARHAVKRKKQPVTGLDLKVDELHGDGAADTAATLAELAAALDKLPLEMRTVLSLVAIEGLSHEEVAEVLGVPVGTVWSRLHNARRKLIAAMSGGD
jgi:RNA polymerase sigma-70 factor (ECF subfamily)